MTLLLAFPWELAVLSRAGYQGWHHCAGPTLGEMLSKGGISGSDIR